MLTVLQVVGFVVLVVGIGLVSIPAALIVGGGLPALVAFGLEARELFKPRQRL